MLYRLARVVVGPLARVLFRMEMKGRDNVPGHGSVIIVANHSSYLDPVLVGLANRREIYYMAKAELFSVPVLGWLIRQFNAFPVRRHVADRAAIRTSLDLLGAGEVVLLFPEGTRYHEEGLGPIQPGAGVIAEKAQCPIVPVTLIGTDRVMPAGARFPRLPKIRVVVGEAIYPEHGGGDAREVRRRAQRHVELAMRRIDEMKRDWRST